MNAATITKFPADRIRNKARARRLPRATRKLRQQVIAGVAVGAVAMTLVGLSLAHFANGIIIVTGAPTWEAWAMAIGFDFGFVALKLSIMLAATPTVRREVEAYAKPAIIGTLIGSAVMNAFAFAWQADGWMIYPAAAFGVVIPALVYVLTRVGTTLWIDRRH